MLHPHRSHTAPTDTLLITNFVRPFTIQQLQSFLGQRGTILDFWMDHIKTHCFVTYTRSEDASLAQREIDGTVWPADTGKSLHVKFVARTAAVHAIKEEEQRSSPSVHRIGYDEAKQSAGTHEPVHTSLPATSGHSSTLSSPNGATLPSPNGATPAAPAKSLDELFKKTSAEPAVYYLPLTDAQVEEKRRHAYEHVPPKL